MTYKEFRKKCPAKYCGEITGRLWSCKLKYLRVPHKCPRTKSENCPMWHLVEAATRKDK